MFGLNKYFGLPLVGDSQLGLCSHQLTESQMKTNFWSRLSLILINAIKWWFEVESIGGIAFNGLSVKLVTPFLIHYNLIVVGGKEAVSGTYEAASGWPHLVSA